MPSAVNWNPLKYETQKINALTFDSSNESEQRIET